MITDNNRAHGWSATLNTHSERPVINTPLCSPDFAHQPDSSNCPKGSPAAAPFSPSQAFITSALSAAPSPPKFTLILSDGKQQTSAYWTDHRGARL